MTPQGIAGIALFTGDLDETVRFWTNVLQAKLVRAAREESEPGLRHYYFDVGGSLVIFYEFPAQNPETLQFGWMHHLNLRAGSVEELEAWKEHIVRCEVPVSDVRDQGFQKSIVLHDNNGILVEIVVPSRAFSDEDLKHDVKPVLALREMLHGQPS